MTESLEETFILNPNKDGIENVSFLLASLFFISINLKQQESLYQLLRGEQFTP